MMMLGPVSAWLVWGVLALAGCGLWAVLWQAGQLARYVWERWRDRGAFGPAEETERELSGLCGECFNDVHCDGAIDTCACTCTWPEGWAEQPEEFPPLAMLPPERSAGELGFTGEQPAVRERPPVPGGRQRGDGGQQHQHLTELRERRASWWEAECRGAYESLNLDYPSGLITRIRENL